MKQQINLYQAAFREPPGPFSALNMIGMLAVLLVVGLGIYGYGVWQIRGLQAKVAELSDQRDKAAARLQAIGNMFPSKNASGLLVRELQLLSTDVETKERLLTAYGDLRRGGGFARHLQALARQRVEGLWLTGFVFDNGPRGIELSGRSRSPALVPLLVQRLRAEPAFQGTRFSTLQIARGELPPEVVGQPAATLKSGRATVDRFSDLPANDGSGEVAFMLRSRPSGVGS